VSDPRQVPTGNGPGRAAGPATTPAAAVDPLRLCIFATVALLGWLLGPLALVFFAGLGFVGYWRARHAGLMSSRCVLGDTRIVLAYLGLLVLAGAGGVAFAVLGGHVGL